MIFLANFFCRIWIFSDTPVFDLRNIFWAGGWQNQWKKWKYHKKTTLFTSIFSTKNIFEKKNFCYLIFEYDFLGKFFLQNLNFFRYPHFLDLNFFFFERVGEKINEKSTWFCSKPPPHQLPNNFLKKKTFDTYFLSIILMANFFSESDFFWKPRFFLCIFFFCRGGWKNSQKSLKKIKKKLI